MVGSGLLLAIAIVGAAVFALVRLLSRPPGPAPVTVPSAWAAFRTSEMHNAHLASGKVACKDCHDEARGFESPGAAPCVKCHEDQVKRGHGGGATAAKDAAAGASCLGCHPFAPDEPAPTCVGCHALTALNANTTASADPDPDPDPPAREDGDAPPVAMHVSVDCKRCHAPHGDPAVKDAPCTQCHDEKASHHANKDGGNGCRDCHVGHASAATAASMCTTCHETPAGPNPAGHPSCTTCHKPHEPAASAVAACAGCHGQKPILAADRAPAHQQCVSCHTPHSPGGAASSCKGCHADVHADQHDRGNCIGCHAPHGRAASSGAIVADCTTCHAKVATNDHGAHAGSLACTDCHQQHEFTPPERPAGCARCHAGEAERAATNHGHADCTNCHGANAHAPATAPTCGSCHAVEASSAPSGHAKCTGCHEPHSGNRHIGSTCATCHASEAATPHGKASGGCTTCHRPHGPSGVASPPACASCHDRASLPALHAESGHATCTNCHSGHGAPRADRATCTGSCHADRRDHQPQAVACTGCHVFKH
ncbi:MAG TPA: hypothetical protein VHB21_11200 [Minicystis sp.]|nr:hypothetical protein [Minicystis sp.]